MRLCPRARTRARAVLPRPRAPAHPRPYPGRALSPLPALLPPCPVCAPAPDLGPGRCSRAPAPPRILSVPPSSPARTLARPSPRPPRGPMPPRPPAPRAHGQFWSMMTRCSWSRNTFCFFQRKSLTGPRTPPPFFCSTLFPDFRISWPGPPYFPEALVFERFLRDLGITGSSRGAFTLLGPDSIYQISL